MSPLKPFDQHEAESKDAYDASQKARFAMFDSPPEPNGLACPQCGSELMDTYPGCGLIGDFPDSAWRTSTHCPKCQWKGARRV